MDKFDKSIWEDSDRYADGIIWGKNPNMKRKNSKVIVQMTAMKSNSMVTNRWEKKIGLMGFCYGSGRKIEGDKRFSEWKSR